MLDFMHVMSLGESMCFSDFPDCFKTFKTLCFYDYALILRQDYDVTSSLRRGALQLETTFSEYRQTNPFVDAVSAILGIVHQYMTQQTTEAVREAVQIQTDRLQDSLQRENDEFLRNIDENIKKIIKGQVKSQVKEQVSRILPRIEESMNATLEAEVLTRSSHSSRTSYAIAADLSEMELKKILIEKMKGNNEDERMMIRKDPPLDQTEATESAGISTTGSQFRQLSASESAFAEEPMQTTCQMKEPSHLVFETGADDQPIVQTSQHPEWFSQPKRPPSPDQSVNATLEAEVLTRSSHSSRASYAVAADLSEMELKKILIEKMEGNKSIQRSDEQRNLYKAEDERMIIRKDPPLDQTGGLKDEEKEGSMHQLALHLKQLPRVQADLPQGLNLDSCLPPRRPPTLDRDWNKTLPAAQGNAQKWISELARQTDARSSFNELLDTPIDFSNFIMNRLHVDTLTPELLAGPTYELMRGSCNSLTELEYHLEEVYKATTDQLDWVNPEGQQYPHNLLQPLPLIPDNWGRRKRQQFYGYAVNQESALDVYSKRRIIAVTKLKIVEWHDYKHLDWISV
nr:hypothetical protein [Tanacetum cinerariifolium]